MSPTLPTPEISEPSLELKAERLQVARFRAAMDWMLAHPKWEAYFEEALLSLQFKGQRQGVALAKAMRSLPLDRKFELVRVALQPDNELAIPSYPEARRLARLWGITNYKPRKDFGRPSASQWQGLRKQTTLALVSRYEKYKTAQTRLYQAFEALPSLCAQTICRSSSQFEDAQQEARLGLLEAIDRIDPDQSFEAYARQWINRRIRNFVMQNRLPVRAPINLISKTLRNAPGGNPALAQAIREGTVQLDELESSPQLQSEAAQEPHTLSADNDDKEKVSAALETLSDKQREVIELRFGLSTRGDSPRSLSEVAKCCGISRQQVHRREQRALQRLLKTLEGVALERDDLLLPAGRS